MSVNKMQVIIYTDGAAKGNPGPGGYGAVLKYTDTSGSLHTKEISQGYKLTTNNRMELLAAIRALQALKRPCRVKLYSDSKYLVEAMNKHWLDSWVKKGWKKSDKKPVKNVDLWKEFIEAKNPHDIEFIWVKGHNDNPDNERCDYLATTAAAGDDLIEDENFNGQNGE